MFLLVLAYSLSLEPTTYCMSSMDDKGVVAPIECQTEITPESQPTVPGPTGNSGQPERQ